MDQLKAILSGMEERQLGPGPATSVKRQSDRARYDAGAIHAIIDEALICHVSFVQGAEALCLPVAHARSGDTIFLHGAVANRMCHGLARGARACLTFTLLDGLVFARSAFHHSMNYRSVVAYGSGRAVTDVDEKRRALRALMEHVAPGRLAEVGEPSPSELQATLVVAVEIEEASAKVRQGPALDPPERAAVSPEWAGVVPLRLSAAPPERDPCLPPERAIASSVLERAQALGAEPTIELRQGELLFSTDKTRLDLELVHRFLSEEAYWSLGVERARLERGIAGSLCFGLFRVGAQIGFARVVTDSARFAYLADVFVLAHERGRGLGQRLIRFALDHPNLQDVSRIALGTRDAHALYARFGFIAAETGRQMVKLAGT